jgi:hypothetical protein
MKTISKKNGRRPPKKMEDDLQKKWKTTSKINKKDDLKKKWKTTSKKNGRQTQKKMEDDLKKMIFFEKQE